MKRIFVLIVFLILGASCSKTEPLQLSLKSYYKKTAMPCESHQCTEAKLLVPVVEKGNEAVATRINEVIFNEIAGLISFEEQPAAQMLDYDDVLNSFIQSYEEVKRDFPQEGAPWVADVEGAVVFESSKLLSLGISYYTFTGGAHGFKGVQVVHFNPENGSVYQLKDLIVDWESFSNLVENRVRAKWGVPEESPINSRGLMFEDDTFSLPETLYIYKDSVVAYYNVYEIASYADGPTEVVIPMEEVKNMLMTLE